MVTRSRKVTGLGKIDDGICGFDGVGYGPWPLALYIVGDVGSSRSAGMVAAKDSQYLLLVVRPDSMMQASSRLMGSVRIDRKRGIKAVKDTMEWLVLQPLAPAWLNIRLAYRCLRHHPKLRHKLYLTAGA